MNSYINYDYYINAFKGDLIPVENFNKYSAIASNKVRTRIFNRDISLFENEVKNATCLVAEILYNQYLNQEKLKNVISGNEKIVTSEKIGDYSRNISNVSANDLQKLISTDYINDLIENTLEDSLYPTGLLCCGGF